MKIGEFAICTGLSKDTIRYYEKMNLLQPEIKNKHRYYNKKDIDTVEAILKLKQTGFSLQEIKMLFDWSGNIDQNKKLTKEEIQNLLEIKVIFQEKYEQMLQREHQLKQIKQVLLNIDNKIKHLLEKNKEENCWF
ncbi:MerR family transcriptional regulator [Lysinibacillus capsici]|uniref:MerR family transcriptional regulator n=1 Tax=Lysinibacillus capsici TaxID=2115968 RepID=A0ABY8KNR7_9BACI|nr:MULTISPECIES: MerR family transcriptional regulator [Lysinibacillus]AUS87076.1 MerR family DNA-binding transcriptional regulator [Lysinibacillus sp. YS11]MCT1538318.1 MerR family transcriptional regulator [Lysinibacillus capsici]MCT1569027.1 MerR family transcriptional regulator [Lysinibacillus capsici]MCT1646042.1 MerR family transcriptional regulator [Lysinibacillus capsici]MCT1725452.1 MerR family transcriptional regulator [Lysinibacillus capsici]